MTKSDAAQFLPTSVQKSYFMLSRSARAVLDTALRAVSTRPVRGKCCNFAGVL